MANISTTTFVGTPGFGDTIVVQRNAAPKPPTNPVTRNQFAVLTQPEVGFRKFVYRDYSPNFTFHPITGDLASYTDFSAVSQAIKNIILTEKNERHFSQVEFGVGIERFLFSPLTPELSDDIAEEIIAQVSKYEPRAIIYEVVAEGAPESNGLMIRVKYGIKTFPNTQEVTLFIERA